MHVATYLSCRLSRKWLYLRRMIAAAEDLLGYVQQCWWWPFTEDCVAWWIGVNPISKHSYLKNRYEKMQQAALWKQTLAWQIVLVACKAVCHLTIAFALNRLWFISFFVYNWRLMVVDSSGYVIKQQMMTHLPSIKRLWLYQCTQCLIAVQWHGWWHVHVL